MALTTTKIETVAVTEFAQAFLECLHLEDHLDRNDRTPFTDGHVDLYCSSESHSKDYFVGRVAVQVKGRRLHDRPTHSISLQRSDMEGFLTMGGVLYLVCLVGEDGKRRELYYYPLTPFVLAAVIRSLPRESHSRSFQLRPFPQEASEIEALVRYCHRSQRQVPNQPTRLAEEIAEFRLVAARPLDLSRPQSFSLHEGHAYMEAVTVDGKEMAMEVDFNTVPDDYVERVICKPVTVADIQFPSYRVRRLNEHSFAVRLTDTMAMTISGLNRGAPASLNFNFQWSPTLGERISEVNFAVHVMSGKLVNIGGIELAASADNEEALEDLVAYANDLGEFRDGLLVLGANPCEWVMEEVDRAQLYVMRRLVQAAKGESGLSKEHQSPGRLRVELGSNIIEVFLHGTPESPDLRVVNPFASDGAFIYVADANGESREENARLVTPYELISIEDLPKIANLNLDAVIGHYGKLKSAPHFQDLVDQAVLRFWFASQCSERRCESFLRAALALTDMSLDSENMGESRMVWEANALLLRRELREEVPDSLEVARKLRRVAYRKCNDMSPFVALACSVVLDDRPEVTSCYGELSEAQLRQLHSWPFGYVVEKYL